jgi:hypothetical protein
MTGVPKSTWYALMATGQAPKPVKLGPRSVAWIEREVEIWMRELERRREPSNRQTPDERAINQARFARREERDT